MVEYGKGVSAESTETPINTESKDVVQRAVVSRLRRTCGYHKATVDTTSKWQLSCGGGILTYFECLQEYRKGPVESETRLQRVSMFKIRASEARRHSHSQAGI